MKKKIKDLNRFDDFMWFNTFACIEFIDKNREIFMASFEPPDKGIKMRSFKNNELEKFVTVLKYCEECGSLYSNE